MIGIKKKLQNILSHLINNRQVGTTTLIHKIAKENDVYVIVDKMEERDDFDPSVRKNVITPETIHKIKDGDKKPILIDNGVLHRLLVDAILEMGKKDEIIKHREHVISAVKEVIKLSGDLNPHGGHRLQIGMR